MKTPVRIGQKRSSKASKSQHQLSRSRGQSTIHCAGLNARHKRQGRGAPAAPGFPDLHLFPDARWGSEDTFNEKQFRTDTVPLLETNEGTLVRNLEGELFITDNAIANDPKTRLVYRILFTSACKWIAHVAPSLDVTAERFLQLHGIHRAASTPGRDLKLQLICLSEHFETTRMQRLEDGLSNMLALAELAQHNPDIPEVHAMRRFVDTFYKLTNLYRSYGGIDLMDRPTNTATSKAAVWFNGWLECLSSFVLVDAMETVKRFSARTTIRDDLKEAVELCRTCVAEYAKLEDLVRRVNRF